MNDLGIVIQGPTTYFREMADHYKHYRYLVWSTWADEPEDCIAAIRDSNIDVLINDKPAVNGNWNTNLQCISSLNGINYLKDKYPHIDRFLKIRSDLLIAPVAALVDSVNRSLDKSALCSMGYFIGHPFTLLPDYFMMDFMIGGHYNRLTDLFSVKDQAGAGLPFPEKWFEIHYFGSGGYIKQHVAELKDKYFFLDWSKMNFSFLKDRMNTRNFHVIDGYLINKATFAELVQYYGWIYPKFLVKKIIKRSKAR